MKILIIVGVEVPRIEKLKNTKLQFFMENGEKIAQRIKTSFSDSKANDITFF